MSEPPKKAVLLLALCALAGCATPSHEGIAKTSEVAIESTITEIKDLAEVAPVLTAAGARSLLVLDVDDTLLTSPVFFGSDRWYGWQSTLASGDPRKLVCLNEISAMNYESGVEIPTQANGPSIINGLAGDKIILTARGPGTRGPTERELTEAGYRLPDTLAPTPDGVFFAWQPGSSTKPVTMSYYHGLFMVAGRDKGKMLVALLTRMHRRYERVLLLDDGRRNIDAMAAALKEAGIGYHGLWYTRVDKSKPTPEEERAAVDDWEAWKALLSRNFPGRLERIKEPCAY